MTNINFLETIIVINIKIVFCLVYLPSIVADKVPFCYYRCVHLKFIIGKPEAKKANWKIVLK